MKPVSKFTFVAMLLTLLLSSLARASVVPVLLGVQPEVTVEPFYESGEFDINLLPIVVGIKLNDNLDVRATTLANYHAGGSKNGFEQLGLQFLLPFQFYQVSKHGRLFVGPCLSHSRWMMRELSSTTLCGEGGFIIFWPSQMELKVGAQVGATYFSSPPLADGQHWNSHFGVKVSLGYWLKR